MVNTSRRIASALLLALALLAASMGGASAVHAQSSGANAEREAAVRQMLDERDREIKGILGTQDSFSSAQREKLMGLINGLIDFRAMGSEALGERWGDLSYDQQQEFVRVFSQVVAEQSLADLAPYRAPVTYESIRVDGDDGYVKTTSTQQGERIPVEYDLVYRATEGGGGEWRARDIVVDGVSTVDGYKRSFRSIIRRHGYDALMKSLRKRLERSKKG